MTTPSSSSSSLAADVGGGGSISFQALTTDCTLDDTALRCTVRRTVLTRSEGGVGHRVMDAYRAPPPRLTSPASYGRRSFSATRRDGSLALFPVRNTPSSTDRMRQGCGVTLSTVVLLVRIPRAALAVLLSWSITCASREEKGQKGRGRGFSVGGSLPSRAGGANPQATRHHRSVTSRTL